MKRKKKLICRSKQELPSEYQPDFRYSREQAAAYLNFSVETLWRRMKENKIAYYRVGKHLLFNKKDLDDYIESCFVDNKIKDH